MSFCLFVFFEIGELVRGERRTDRNTQTHKHTSQKLLSYDTRLTCSIQKIPDTRPLLPSPLIYPKKETKFCPSSDQFPLDHLSQFTVQFNSCFERVMTTLILLTPTHTDPNLETRRLTKTGPSLSPQKPLHSTKNN